MEKGRSLVTNIDRKGKWRPDTGGDKRKEWEKKGKACFYRENTIKEFKLTNEQIRAKRLRKQERPNDSEKKQGTKDKRAYINHIRENFSKKRDTDSQGQGMDFKAMLKSILYAQEYVFLQSGN